MRVLLTGASGFVGRHISRQFADHELVTLGRSSTHDLRADLAAEAPSLPLCDLVIHAAGKAHSVPRSPSEALSFFDVNTTGTANLLAGLDRVGVPSAFVLVSTVAVYGRESGVGIGEDERLTPRGPYGESKRDAEALVTGWCLSRGVRCTVLRLPLVAGRNPPGNMGAMIRGIRRGYYFNVAGGKAAKSIVLASDVAEVIPRAAEVGGVYNLTDGIHPTFAQLSAVVARQLGRPTPPSIRYGVAAVLAAGGDLLGGRSPINSSMLRMLTSDLTFDDSRARANIAWRPRAVLDGLSVGVDAFSMSSPGRSQ